ncbi:MAG: AAA family ATPase [Chlorobiaceae bacterium]|nr:AAA family ATPase [Chlorobiaceae bacterium]NTW73575.1 AAA family ATPase [Chlorobiaceae bacterium]
MNTVAKALSHPEAYPHRVEADGCVQVVETHISWIFLTGRFAYKLKKPVDLGFLDFSTLERRHHCCLEELRLNRRLCPDLYLDVLPVVLINGHPFVGGEGVAIDYVVRMVQFDRDFELDRLLKNGALTAGIVSEIAEVVAAFHQSARHAPASTAYGNPDVLLKPMLENLDRTGELIHTPEESASMQRIRTWTLDEHHRLGPVMRERKENGFIRECHGDMHTGNMVIWNGRVMIFDCIEFNPNLSVIDVMSDAAFLFMDLQHSGSSELAWRFLDGYLQETGDYEGLRVLRLYCTYRAMVRAKVTAIRLMQERREERRDAVLEEHRTYLAQSLRYLDPAPPALVLMHGVSGTGKSFHAKRIAEAGGFVHLRSDVERKRLFGIRPLESSRNQGLDIYTGETTDRTYRVLLGSAEAALAGGWTVIVDATFLKKRQRRPFIELAGKLGCRCCILNLHAPLETLRNRIVARSVSGDDPSEADVAVLESQLLSVEAPDDSEKALCIDIETEGPVNHAALAVTISSNSSGG